MPEKEDPIPPFPEGTDNGTPSIDRAVTSFHRAKELAAEVAALEADTEDRTEMGTVAQLMASMRALSTVLCLG